MSPSQLSLILCTLFLIDFSLSRRILFFRSNLFLDFLPAHHLWRYISYLLAGSVTMHELWQIMTGAVVGSPTGSCCMHHFCWFSILQRGNFVDIVFMQYYVTQRRNNHIWLESWLIQTNYTCSRQEDVMGRISAITLWAEVVKCAYELTFVSNFFYWQILWWFRLIRPCWTQIWRVSSAIIINSMWNWKVYFN